MKLKNVQAYPIKDVPDHLVQECANLGLKLCTLITDNIEGHDPNIVLGALSFVHASMIKNIISNDRDQVEKAGKLYAFAMLKNLDALIERHEKGEID